MKEFLKKLKEKKALENGGKMDGDSDGGNISGTDSPLVSSSPSVSNFPVETKVETSPRVIEDGEIKNETNGSPHVVELPPVVTEKLDDISEPKDDSEDELFHRKDPFEEAIDEPEEIEPTKPETPVEEVKKEEMIVRTPKQDEIKLPEEKVEEKKEQAPHDYKKYPLIDNFGELYPEPIEKIAYLEEDAENCIWEDEKDGKKSPKEATLDKLIELLTSGSYYDIHMQNTFMLTFRSFTDQETLFKKLVERFNIPPPKESTPEELAKFKVEKLDKIRLRIASTIKYWIESFYNFDFNDLKMREKVYDVIKMMELCRGGKIYSGVITRALAKANEESSGSVQSKVEFPPTMFPAVTLQKRQSFFSTKDKTVDVKPKHKVLQWPSIEIARQICLLDFGNFLKIEPKECLNQAWAKGQRETKAPGICAMVNQFNTLSMWVGTVVVQATDPLERVKVVEKFVDIAQKLWELNNLNAVFTITSGLALAAVYRLKKTWPLISDESRKDWETLQAAISSKNYSAIRTRIKNVKPPAIPYIGIYLTDLTFTEDGNPKYINGKINFVKCKCFAGIIRDLQTYQNTKYQFAVCKELYDQLASATGISEDEMFKMSLEIEPKEVKKKPEVGSPKTPTPEKKK